jgi:hypothetical protein
MDLGAPPDLQDRYMPWLSKTFYRAHSALRGAAVGTVERPYHHSVVFGKSGKHRANKLAAPGVFRDGYPVPMQKISLITSTKA